MGKNKKRYYKAPPPLMDILFKYFFVPDYWWKKVLPAYCHFKATFFIESSFCIYRQLLIFFSIYFRHYICGTYFHFVCHHLPLFCMYIKRVNDEGPIVIFCCLKITKN